MRCSCCGYESLDLCQVSMTTYCGQMPHSENVECTARVLHLESCKEIKSCRGVKSPQNGEVLQKHSRSWLGGDDQTLCHMKGRLANLPTQLLGRAIGRICCCDHCVCSKKGREIGEVPTAAQILFLIFVVLLVLFFFI